MKRANVLAAAAAIVMTSACSDAPSDPPAPEAPEASTAAPLSVHAHEPWRHDETRGHARRSATVMTRNLYVGFDITTILSATSPEQVPVVVAAGWAQILANDFPERSGALADEIATTHPDLVGLQEVSLLRRFPQGGGAPQVIDYLALLQAALAARGVDYEVAVIANEIDIAAPMFAGVDASGAPILDTVQLLDRDVILARAGVRTSQPRAAQFAARVPVSIAGTSVEIVRGWASVLADIDGVDPFRFVNTHLETQSFAAVQVLQAIELAGILAFDARPQVLVGDFNSAADGSQTPTYGILTGVGFEDLWSEAHPTEAGYTCCQPEDLSETDDFDQRIDLVLVRGAFGKRPRLAGVNALLVGEELDDRTASGLWPSDHAGVVASFRLHQKHRHPFLHAWK